MHCIDTIDTVAPTDTLVADLSAAFKSDRIPPGYEVLHMNMIVHLPLLITVPSN